MLTASSTDLFALYANWRGSSKGPVMSFRWASTSFSNDFMTTDVILDFFGMGRMVEHLKHGGTSHSSSDLLKILWRWGPAGQHRISDRLVWHRLCLVVFSFSASGSPGTPRLRWSELQVSGRGGLLEVLMVVWRGVQSRCGVFFQICNRTHSDCLPVVDSPECWGMVSCSWLSLSDLSTLMLSHWKRIGSLAYWNNSSLLLLSTFPVCIWPVYTRLYPPSCKHLLWPNRAFWVLQLKLKISSRSFAAASKHSNQWDRDRLVKPALSCWSISLQSLPQV